MVINEGSIDRTIRVIIGVALLALVFVGPKTLWGLVGIIPIATAAIGFCPLYKAIGITTRPARAGG